MNKFEYLEKELNGLVLKTRDFNALEHVAKYKDMELHLSAHDTYMELYISAKGRTIELFDTDINDTCSTLDFAAVHKQAKDLKLHFVDLSILTDLMIDYINDLLADHILSFEEFEAFMRYEE